MLAASSCHKEIEKPAEREKGLRTVLVYQVANNNLGTSQYNEMDIKEMMEGAAAGAIPRDGRLLVYNAGPNANPLLFEITATGNDTLKTYTTDLYSVQSERMLEVLDDMQKFAPSNQYGLVLWSHGSGWIQDGMDDPEDTGITPMSFGADRSRTMNITTLANTLAKGPELDFIYFDCCYMASVETLYELRHAAPVIAASATELLVYGMPYEQNLGDFFSPTADLVSAAGNTFRLYDHLTGSNRTCTMSVINTAGLEGLAKATAAIYSAANGNMPASYEPQRFMNRGISSCTYFDFKQYVEALCIDADGAERFEGATTLLADFNNSLAECVEYAAATPYLWNSVPLTYHCGLSTFILENDSNSTYKNYNTLSWYADVASKLKFY